MCECSCVCVSLNKFKFYIKQCFLLAFFPLVFFSVFPFGKNEKYANGKIPQCIILCPCTKFTLLFLLGIMADWMLPRLSASRRRHRHRCCHCCCYCCLVCVVSSLKKSMSANVDFIIKPKIRRESQRVSLHCHSRTRSTLSPLLQPHLKFSFGVQQNFYSHLLYCSNLKTKMLMFLNIIQE